MSRVPNSSRIPSGLGVPGLSTSPFFQNGSEYQHCCIICSICSFATNRPSHFEKIVQIEIKWVEDTFLLLPPFTLRFCVVSHGCSPDNKTTAAAALWAQLTVLGSLSPPRNRRESLEETDGRAGFYQQWQGLSTNKRRSQYSKQIWISAPKCVLKGNKTRWTDRASGTSIRRYQTYHQ